MTTVASLFESELEATRALDSLAGSEFEDIDYRVYDRNAAGEGTGARVIGLPAAEPNVGGQGPAAILSSADIDLDDEELADFFVNAVETGNAVLVLAEVEDERADALKALFREHGGRTSEDD